jgi:hypothetical protein
MFIVLNTLKSLQTALSYLKEIIMIMPPAGAGVGQSV